MSSEVTPEMYLEMWLSEQIPTGEWLRLLEWRPDINELYHLLKLINPDTRILGSDYKDKYFTGQELNIPIYYHDRNHTFSSSSLRNKIGKLYENKG